MFNVDKPKLEAAILGAVEDVAFDIWCQTTQCIGKFTLNGKRMQVHMTVTRDKDELMTDVPKEHICVTKSKFTVRAPKPPAQTTEG